MAPLVLLLPLQACAVRYASPGEPHAQPPPGESPPPPSAHPLPPPAAPPPAYAPPPAPPPPPHRHLTRDEAIQLAWRYAAQHGLQASRVREVEREEGRWKVELRLVGGGKARVVIDARSGAELRFEAKQEGRRHHRERHEGDDD